VLIVLAAAFGLIVGSFLNVVIARVPDGESVVRPGSRCPACLVPIAPRDNVPVLSWVLLRGRARCCGVRISVRYPLVEAGTAIAFATVAAWSPTVWLLPALLYLAAVSIALALIDVDTFRLPYGIGEARTGLTTVGSRCGPCSADC
jgi:leader peptidase (prepilin peptidase) / N-methyltransferase